MERYVIKGKRSRKLGWLFRSWRTNALNKVIRGIIFLDISIKMLQKLSDKIKYKKDRIITCEFCEEIN